MIIIINHGLHNHTVITLAMPVAARGYWRTYS